jgi:type I site-specific restriction-modification system R (restriction) subunit
MCYNSGQLAAVLAGEQARIIITTLQKFPFVIERVDALRVLCPPRQRHPRDLGRGRAAALHPVGSA